MPVSHRVRLAAFSCLALVAPATLGHARTPEQQMLMIEPSERIEQRCNARGMGEVGRAGKGLKPDELVAYAYADPVIRGGRITAKGAAVRSGRTWYHLAYECETERDGLDVKSFSFTLGESIPEAEWGAHYLVAP